MIALGPLPVDTVPTEVSPPPAPIVYMDTELPLKFAVYT